MVRINVDFRLLDVSLELDALENHLQLIEKQIDHVGKKERLRLDTLIRKERLSSDEPEWHEAVSEYTQRIEFLLPRFFRGPFLVALYAVYESAVIELARLIQGKQSQPISMDDLRGDLLRKAKKYFSHILKFELCTNQKTWHKITMLSELRNALAHANGRVEMLNEGSRKKIRAWERLNLGLSTHYGYLIVEPRLARELFESVRTSLDELVRRYKEWDDEKTCV